MTKKPTTKSFTVSNGIPLTNGIPPTQWKPTEVRNAPVRDTFSFDSMEDALDTFAAGGPLVVMDDENRENEGDLIISAAHCTTEKMAFMIKHTRCLIFFALFLPPHFHAKWMSFRCSSYQTNLFFSMAMINFFSAVVMSA
jgi:3,4-dihydroxy 2-butanone 4-phosphate synthase